MVRMRMETNNSSWSVILGNTSDSERNEDANEIDTR